MTITALPTPPSRSDSANFATRGDAFLAALPTFATEANALQADVNAKQATASAAATSATDSAAAALVSANNAAADAGAALWVSGTTYSLYAIVRSPLNSQTYKRIVAGDGTTDPSADTTNWAPRLLDVSTTLPSMRPSLLLDFANSRAVDGRITFTRASTATRTNANGLIETVASGVPRIDFDPITLACKGLLVEESRTNLLTYSEQFDNAAWTKTNANITISANSIASPDGTTTADTAVIGTGGTESRVVQAATVANDSATYTASVYLKRVASETEARIDLRFTGGTGLAYAYAFAWSNHQLSLVSGAVAATSTSVTDAGNGWYRVSITAPNNASGNTASGMHVYAATSSVGTIVSVGQLYIWGAQLEAGAFATSYIPTTSAQVTRAADVATMTGANFSSWYRADEGSFVVTSDEANSVSGFPRKFTVHDGTANNTIQTLTFGSSDALIFSMTTSGVTQASQTAVSEYTGQTASVAVAYKANDSASSANGATATVDSSCTPPSGINALRIGAALDGTEAINGHIARIAYYPKRLTNTELQALSA